MRGAREIQLSAVLVDLVMLKTTEGLVGGEDHLATVLPVTVIVFLFVGVRAAVVAATFLEERVGDPFLSLVFPQMLPNLARILQGGTATIQPAVMVFPARVTGTVSRRRYQIR